MSDKLQVIIDLADAEERAIYDRERIGFLAGLRAGITHVRLSEDLDKEIRRMQYGIATGIFPESVPDPFDPQPTRPADPFDVGRLRGLRKVKEILEACGE